MACRGMDPAKTQRGHGVATSGSGMGAARNAARLSALLLEHALRSSGESGELLYCAAGSSRSRRRPRRRRWYTSSATTSNSTSTSEPNHTASTAATSTSRSTTRRASLNRQGGTTMKLYNHSQAPNPRRVRIFMAEKGISLPMEEIDLMAGKNRAPEFLAKNPSGGLPVLELDDGGCIAESVAICRYLEGQHPEPNLMGRNP